MTLLAKLRAKHISLKLAQYTTTYDECRSSVDEFQLRSLNTSWSESLKRSHWARALQKKLNAPDEFKDWETFNRLIPIQKKADIKSLVNSDVGKSCKKILWRSTGGTTAEPVRFPIFQSETEIASLDIWLGRHRLGISPDDRLFLLWGHSHLFGVGLKGLISRIQRVLSDRMLGYTRWSAYRLSPSDLSEAAKKLIKCKAQYVLGYASALDRFALHNSEYASAIRKLKLRAVIATAESFPNENSRNLLSEFFGCPVVMEYGTVETGPMAYERLSGGYDVFWAHHRIELVESPYSGGDELVVTSLFPRAVPLLRYAVGDIIKIKSGDTDCKQSFSTVIGRCNDIVTTPKGVPVHSEAFSHALRDIPNIEAFQIVRSKNNSVIRINYVSTVELGSDVVKEIRRRLALIDPDFFDIPLERLGIIEKGVAGKSVMVIEGIA